MSSDTAPTPQRGQAPSSENKIVPLFVCPGARDVPLEYAVFPHGSGFSHLRPCPGRELCTWYAAHDLGGNVRFNELPAGALLEAEFISPPFSCPHFQDNAAELHELRPHRTAAKRACHG